MSLIFLYKKIIIIEEISSLGKIYMLKFRKLGYWFIPIHNYMNL